MRPSEPLELGSEPALHSQILKNLAEGVYLVNVSDLSIAYANPKLEEMFGYKPGEMLGQHVGIINAPSDIDPLEVARMIETDLKEKGGWSGNVHNKKKDGTRFWCHVNISAFDHPRLGRVWLSIQQDIDDRIQAEEALQAALAAAKKADQAKSEFLASMSHELRTPLNAIIGFSEIIKTERLGPVGNERYRTYAADISESGTHLLDLINDILDLSKIGSGTEDLHEEHIDIAAFVPSILTLVRQQAHEQRIKLTSEIPGELPPVRADRRKLKQILVNLLSNALKFTPACGRVTIKISCGADSGYAFEISDTGIGIAAEDIPKAMSQFGQVDSAHNRQFAGTGLGLPLTKALTELHGGTLDLRSTVGGGTCATVRFPATRTVGRRGTAPAPATRFA